VSTERFLNRSKSAKGELASELAHNVVLDGAQVVSSEAVLAVGKPGKVLVRGREVDNFSSWDFLGVARDARVERAAGQALRKYGVGRPEPRGLGGFTPDHLRCEERFASFYGAESATLFSQKSQSVLSIITALCRQGDLVLAPNGGAWALGDACAVADVEYEEFSNLEDLEKRLVRTASAGRSFRRVLLGVEAVSTLTGEESNIGRIFDIAERFDCLTLVDESVGFGVIGSRGAASAELWPRHPSLVGRLVALANCSGIEISALVGPRELRDLLYSRSHYLQRECAPSPLAVCAAVELIDIVETASLSRVRVKAHATKAVFGTRAVGWSVSGGDGVPLLSFHVESSKVARRIQGAFLEQGVLVDIAESARGRLRGGIVRISFSAAHSEEAIGRFLSASEQVYLRMR
jgi:7-keto-8-aminopelargonate synthetase-like enzyme